MILEHRLVLALADFRPVRARIPAGIALADGAAGGVGCTAFAEHNRLEQRTRLERALPAVRRLEHVLGDRAQRRLDLQPRRDEVAGKRRGIGAHRAVAVERHVAGRSGIADQHVAFGAVDAGEAPGGDATGGGPLHRGEERVVATGIQQHELQLRGAGQRMQEVVEQDRLVFDVAVRGELRIDGDEEIVAAHLDAMAGIVDEADIGTGDLFLEAGKGLRHRRAAGVLEHRHLEAGRLQRRLHRRDVVGRVLQLRRRRGIGGIADQKGGLARGKGRLADDDGKKQDGETKQHGPLTRPSWRGEVCRNPVGRGSFSGGFFRSNTGIRAP